MKQLPVGLLIEGNSTSSVLLRLPGIITALGPIKSSGFQVARRVSNFLKGGFAARSYTELNTARTILIRCPDKSVPRLVNEIISSGLNCSQHVFILCETWAPTESLKPLQDLGAKIASLVLLPAGAEPTFVLEGDPPAVRQMRGLLERAGAKTVELKSNTKHLLLAAATLCRALPMPLLMMAQQALRESGVSANQQLALIKDMSSEMLTDFLKGARLNGAGLLEESGDNQDFYWQRLTATHPDLATNLRPLIDLSHSQKARKRTRGQTA